MAKHRWIIEGDYEELKQELGLGHFEGRGWRGFHHHGTLGIAAYGFLVAERSRFPPCARAGRLELPTPSPPESFQPRGRPTLQRATSSALHRHTPPHHCPLLDSTASVLSVLWHEIFVTQ